MVGVGFFFSSRRRHTSFDCDWSSDVCSSDLDELTGEAVCAFVVLKGARPTGAEAQKIAKELRDWRSEERRVGKECRAKCYADYLEKKGNGLCTVATPCSINPPSTWFYKRVW